MASKPKVLVLTLGLNHSLFDDMCGHLITELGKQATIVRATTLESALAALDGRDLSAILCADEGLLNGKYNKVNNQLGAFVRKGGKLVFGCLSSRHGEVLRQDLASPLEVRIL